MAQLAAVRRRPHIEAGHMMAQARTKRPEAHRAGVANERALDDRGRVALQATETNIGTMLWQINAPNRLCGRIEDHNAVDPFAASPAAPQIAIYVAARVSHNPGYS